MTARASLAALFVLAATAVAGCGSGAKLQAAPAPAPSCPTRGAWERVAARAHVTVLCPTWMPHPLDARIGGDYANGADVKGDRSYLVSFLWHEGPVEAHVNFRGYPGRTAIPHCLKQTGSKNVSVPCFDDPHPSERLGPYRATLYTANLDADQWHVLYAWRSKGSLYTASMHVAPPYSFSRALAALRHVVRSLVPVQPS
jgi:hypothetical protein